MITTAVQQPSQTVEIQGASATVPASQDVFRATFVASVENASPLKSDSSAPRDTLKSPVRAAAEEAPTATPTHKVSAGLSKAGGQGSSQVGGATASDTDLQDTSGLASYVALQPDADQVPKVEDAQTLKATPTSVSLLPAQRVDSDLAKLALSAGVSAPTTGANVKATATTGVAKAATPADGEEDASVINQKTGAGSAKKAIVATVTNSPVQVGERAGLQTVSIQGTENIATLIEVAPALIQSNVVQLVTTRGSAVQAADRTGGSVSGGTLLGILGSLSSQSVQTSLDPSATTAAPDLSSSAVSSRGKKSDLIAGGTTALLADKNQLSVSSRSSLPADGGDVASVSSFSEAQIGTASSPSGDIARSIIEQQTAQAGGALKAKVEAPQVLGGSGASRSVAASGRQETVGVSDARRLEKSDPAAIAAPQNTFLTSATKLSANAQPTATKIATNSLAVDDKAETQVKGGLAPASDEGPAPLLATVEGGVSAAPSPSLITPVLVSAPDVTAGVASDAVAAGSRRLNSAEKIKLDSGRASESTTGESLAVVQSTSTGTAAVKDGTVSAGEAWGSPLSNAPGAAPLAVAAPPSGLASVVAASAGQTASSAHTAAPVGASSAPAISGGAAALERVWGGGTNTLSAELTSTGAQSGDSHRTLQATPTALEVGIQSGTQGWLRIRAEVGDQGGISASLAAGSSNARELLHSQMPALNAFLHNENIAATTTVLDRTSPASIGPASTGSAGLAFGSSGLAGDSFGSSTGSNSPGGAAFQGGSQMNSQHPSDEDQHRASQSDLLLTTSSTGGSEAARSYDARGGVSEAAGPVSLRTPASGESGRWLNVRV